jgi:hypothetical protein
MNTRIANTGMSSTICRAAGAVSKAESLVIANVANIRDDMSVENGMEKMLYKRLKIFKTAEGAENTEIHRGFSLRVRNFNSAYLRALRVLCGFKIPKKVIQVETDALFQAYFKTTEGAENTEIHGGFSLRVRNFNSVYLRALRVLCGFKIPKKVIQVETDALFQAYFSDIVVIAEGERCLLHPQRSFLPQKSSCKKNRFVYKTGVFVQSQARFVKNSFRHRTILKITLYICADNNNNNFNLLIKF